MRSELSQQASAYALDLVTTDRNGQFPCPRCGVRISPDDFSETVYFIADVVVNGHGLQEIVVCCKMCTSLIHLTGFSKIQAPVFESAMENRCCSNGKKG